MSKAQKETNIGKQTNIHKMSDAGVTRHACVTHLMNIRLLANIRFFLCLTHTREFKYRWERNQGFEIWKLCALEKM